MLKAISPKKSFPYGVFPRALAMSDSVTGMTAYVNILNTLIHTLSLYAR
jgi:crotonobetainyl-CoA:carnitine CoA-transferase CaiB-like acyl-CoA transferase